MLESPQPNIPHITHLPHRGVRLIWVGLILLTLAIILVGAFSEEQSAALTNAPKESTVLIMSNGFSPHMVTIRSGGTVTWENRDAVPHLPVSDQAAFPTGKELKPGKTYSVTFRTAGRHAYHDSVDPSRVGVVIVE